MLLDVYKVPATEWLSCSIKTVKDYSVVHLKNPWRGLENKLSEKILSRMFFI